MSRNRFYAGLFSVVLLLPLPSHAADQLFKNTVIDEVDISGTGYYGRLLVAEDLNNDGAKESIYLKMSPKYMEYVWNKDRAARRQDKAYHKKGVKQRAPTGLPASCLHPCGRTIPSAPAGTPALMERKAACIHRRLSWPTSTRMNFWTYHSLPWI